ncbi:chromosome segregation ATPase [Ligilactobacillus hayakitensis DSM 18933 = JCM 14209]|uniref:Chromosome segregation ATPase n=1 Tax=Ligilactobacillus hayakitensis DSM 18933 = JCM 14209 TaxID=1423755 RepID=A0A0R1WWX8_9LACO|nr:chromosome segregation ATPase [Ligilactobacillus hayakitensis DSM 18933 = JCM 14209]
MVMIIGVVIDGLLGNLDENKNSQPFFSAIFMIIGILVAIYWNAISPKQFQLKRSSKDLEKKENEIKQLLTLQQMKPLELEQLILTKKAELEEEQNKIDSVKEDIKLASEKEWKKYNTKIDEKKKELASIKEEVRIAKEKEIEKYNLQLSSKQVELNQYEKIMAEVQKTIDSKKSMLNEIESDLSKYGEKTSLKESIEKDKLEIFELQGKIEELKNQIISYDDQVNIESFGLYNPHYSFTSSVEYKQKLDDVRQLQKSLIKDGTAGVITEKLLFNNSLAEGQKVQNQNIKQLIRTFNIECEAAINKVTLSNMERIETRINRSFETLNKLNEGNLIKLSPTYLRLKIDELHLAFEYEQKKAEEKEILREQREKEKEERKAQAEIARQRKAVEKERKKQAEHFKQAEALLKEKMENLTDNNDEKYKSLQAEVAKLKAQLAELDEKEASLDYRENHSTAGYVYIISNIGAFGKNVFKIGVTRRLEPLARIKELSSASVPFSFDVHALIFSDDAYKLETDLHNYFDKYRVNKVNNRKEFFGITIDQVKEALNKYYNQTFEFTEIPEAEEYRKSLEISGQENLNSAVELNN